VQKKKKNQIIITIPFLAPWRITIYMVHFASGKTERFSREQADLLMLEVKVQADHLYPDCTISLCAQY